MTANNKISEMVEMETKPASISGTSKIDDEEETKASEVQMELASSSSEEDIAVLELKKQRDQLKKYQKRISEDLEKEKELTRELLQAGKRDCAKLSFRKQKFLKGLMKKTDSQLERFERLVYDIEFLGIQKQVLEGLKNYIIMD